MWGPETSIANNNNWKTTVTTGIYLLLVLLVDYSLPLAYQCPFFAVGVAGLKSIIMPPPRFTFLLGSLATVWVTEHDGDHILGCRA